VALIFRSSQRLYGLRERKVGRQKRGATLLRATFLRWVPGTLAVGERVLFAEARALKA